MIKAIITDLDRTLLRNDRSISEYTIGTLEKCKGNGLLVIAATARPERSIVEYDNIIGFEAKITMNGAVVILPGAIETNTISKDEVRGILRTMSQLNGCENSLETGEGLYSNTDIPEWYPMKVFPDLLNVPLPELIYKVLVRSKAHDLNSILTDILPDSLYYSVAGGELYQIMSRQASKWNGIKAVLNHYKIKPEDAMYFGDDHDDTEPVRKCGVGIAVSNAINEIKDIADIITDSNEQDGVAVYLNKALLN